ncbi:MAG: TolC family protein [Burkholderiaceae bacterium]|nr:TolC family protein [Burkholderiaceae bacterium]
MLLVSVAGANAAGAPAAAVPLLPAELSTLVTAAIRNHPAARSAQAKRRAALQDVAAAERSKWPTLTATTESKVGGVDAASEAMTLRIEQTLWDNGASDARISAVATTAEISALQVTLEQQDLAVQTINAWEAMLTAQRRLNAANTTVTVIEGFKAQMTRRVDSKASPTIDLALVEARLLQTQVERLAATNGLRMALQSLSRLTGMTQLAEQVWADAPQVAAPLSRAGVAAFQLQLRAVDRDALTSNHPLVQKAQLEYAVANAQLKAKLADRWPQAYARIEQPLANNPITGSNQASYLVGLRYTPGAGFSTQLEAAALAERLEAQSHDIEAATRTVTQLIFDDEQTFETNAIQAQAQSASLLGSQQVLASYERQFQAGRKTWQDLLNAAREVAQNEFNLSDAQSAMQGAMYRLQVRLGAIDVLRQD